MFICIWCEDKDRGIGKNNSIPWYLPEDLEFFKQQTLNSKIIMGRKTFESLKKPLPNRTNIVLSKTNNKKIKDVIFFDDYQKLIDLYKDTDEIVYVIGGKKIYDIFIPYSQKLLVSKINKSYDCDVFMDNSFEGFKLVSIENKKGFEIYTYVKK